MRKMIDGKKGVELSLNVIIIAVLCLFVLVIILFIFWSQIKEVASEYTNIFNKSRDEGNKIPWGSPFGESGDSAPASSTPSSTASPDSAASGTPSAK